MTNDDKYRITLYSKRWREEILTYNYPDSLPAIGDMVEILAEDVYFVIYARSFKCNLIGEKSLIPVTLFGEIEGHDENTPKTKFDLILKKLEYKLGQTNDLYVFQRP